MRSLKIEQSLMNGCVKYCECSIKDVFTQIYIGKLTQAHRGAIPPCIGCMDARRNFRRGASPLPPKKP